MLDKKLSLKKNCIHIFLFLFGIALIVFGSNLFISMQKTVFEKGVLQGKTEGRLEMKKEIQEFFTSQDPEEVFEIVGRIAMFLGQDSFIVRVNTRYANPFEDKEDPKADARLVRINEQTELIKRLPKSPEEISLKNDILYNETIIKALDLKIGDEIIIETEGDVKNVSEFFAKKIIVNPFLGNQEWSYYPIEE